MSKKGFKEGMCERKCPVCGKLFYPRCEDWAYKRRKGNSTIYVCSYTCTKGKEARNEHDKIWRK